LKHQLTVTFIVIMKFSATPVFFALLASLTLVNAGPIDTGSEIVRREPSPADSGIEILDARQLDLDEFDLSERDEFDLSERDEFDLSERDEFDLSERDEFDLSERDELEELMELEARGGFLSKPKDPERKSKYPSGNPRPETPRGEFRPHFAGKKDDYFG
jgi:hypothetical protein